MNTLWNKSCALLKDSVTDDIYDRWIAQLEPRSYEHNICVLTCSTEYTTTYINQYLYGSIYDAVKLAANNPNLQLQIVLDESRFQDEIPDDDEIIDDQPVVKPLTQEERVKQSTELNPLFTFDNFVIGPSNQFTCMITKVTSENPGKANNPLFIYGPTGVGKTHLLQSAGNHSLRINPNLKVLYVTSEALLNEYINSFTTGGDMTSPHGQLKFRTKYRTVDILLIDDIQFLKGKKGLQEEFFHMFNTLRDNKKQIILTSDCPPSALNGIEERLISRFQTGLTTEIECPAFETRLAILRYKQESMRFKFSDEILTFVAENVSSSVRALEGALNRLVSFMEFSPNFIINIDFLRHQLKDLLKEESVEQLTCETIQKAVCDYYTLTLADLMGRVRTRNIALPRQIAMFVCRKLTTFSLPEIAKKFDKTHGTVLHSCTQIQNLAREDAQLKKSIMTIASKLGREISFNTDIQG